MINHHVALIYAMVLGAAADGALADSELEMIQGIVQHLPIFEDFEQGNLAQIASACTELLWIDAGGPAAHHRASIVPPLSLHDLPTLLWWDAPINAAESDVRQLLRGVDRVIVDGGGARRIDV